MGSQLSVSAEEETVETETVTGTEDQHKPEETQEPTQSAAQHKVLFLTEDEAKQPSTVNKKPLCHWS